MEIDFGLLIGYLALALLAARMAGPPGPPPPNCPYANPRFKEKESEKEKPKDIQPAPMM